MEFLKHIPEKNKRITTGDKVLSEVDGLRFIAIMAVIVCHVDSMMKDGNYEPANEKLSIFLFSLFQGVQLFFALSGYILSRSYFKGRHQLNGPSLKTYYISRIFRLEPPYFVALLISFFALVFVVDKYSFADLLPHLGIQSIYANWLIHPRTHPKVLPLAWTLEVEVAFYILLPLIYFLYRKNLVVSRIIIYAVSVIIPFSGWSLDNHTNVFFQLPYFFAGIFVADIEVHTKKPLITGTYRVVWKAAVLISLLIIPAILLFPNIVHENFRLDIVPYLLVIILYGVIILKVFNRFFTNKWVAFIGSMCYSLYLIHFMIISVLFKLTMNIRMGNDFFINFLLQCLLLIPACLAGGYIFYRAIERPALLWRNKYLSRKKD